MVASTENFNFSKNMDFKFWFVMVLILATEANSELPDILTNVTSNWSDILQDLAFREERVLHANASSQDGKIPRPKSKDVSETDLYLLGAIEKLVYRVDLMDQRLRRAEDLIQHILDGSGIKRQDPCPGNFSRIVRNCYHFSEKQYNWKAAASACKSLGGNLAETESNEEFLEVVSYILAEGSLRGYDYWTGGINPGLLWIWSNSARPVLKDNPSKSEEIPGSGRCLKLAYTGSTRIYSYFGTDCSTRLRFICEHEENTTERALKRIHKALRNNSDL